ncbi:nickel-dependent hydrogenase large subunit [Clostridium cochlearium]|uniref:nickel-dependent hydrogenase large subunit n=1 Tax=Clostridium cochlearium TaxID=1494 RepID=UPI001570C38E|nr:nickel-dependent hydrogenase large subunit [Clostridium cochlearium]MBV1820220.1 nickel-dependent hydrogenase large subunit [Bacteroidales bacterium MSK.15.36]NSJ90649.1 hypothetical protein [Coprococcus sp. MSK.21.13]
MSNGKCPILKSKQNIPRQVIDLTLENIKKNKDKKINLIWLEASGCSGNIISLLNAEDPDVIYLLREMVNMTYNNSLMAEEGERAFERFLETLDTEFILVVEGAVSTKDNGLYNVIAKYNDKYITGMEAVAMAGKKAKYVLAVGTCASYGGPTAARPNPSESKSVYDFLDRKVIRVPGCPSHPIWAIGTLAHIILYGEPELDRENRPIIFYGVTIHDRCERRAYFDNEKEITENVHYSWYKSDKESITPEEAYIEGDVYKKGAYSRVKAPRYNGYAMEVGPLARMWLSGEYTRGISTMDRTIARVLETKKICNIIENLLNNIKPQSANQKIYKVPNKAKGIGLRDTTRGALGHWINIEEEKIKNYTIITPSTWNLSPQDSYGVKGVVEEALIGTYIKDVKNPVEIGRIVRTFDPCISCATHVISDENFDINIRIT